MLDFKKCQNCGTDVGLLVRHLVPLDRGGMNVETNNYVLCRNCDANAFLNVSPSSGEHRLINFWVSGELYGWLKSFSNSSSMGSVIRFMIGRFINNPDAFEDMTLWADQDSTVKVNVWVPPAEYNEFKRIVDGLGLTVTDALKSLLMVLRDEQSRKG